MSPKFHVLCKQPAEFVKIIFLHPNSLNTLIGKPTSSIVKPS